MGFPYSLAGLRPIRRVRKLSIAAAAEAIGVAPTSYLRFENGARRIYFDKAATLADILGVRTDDLAILMDEIDAARLCDQRDKEALANGTFKLSLVSPGAPSGAVPPPPPSPSTAQVPPPPPRSGADHSTAMLLDDWKVR